MPLYHSFVCLFVFKKTQGSGEQWHRQAPEIVRAMAFSDFPKEAKTATATGQPGGCSAVSITKLLEDSEILSLFETKEQKIQERKNNVRIG